MISLLDKRLAINKGSREHLGCYFGFGKTTTRVTSRNEDGDGDGDGERKSIEFARRQVIRCFRDVD